MNRLNYINNHLNQDDILCSILENGLYSINAINKTINRQILSLAYSPGVGSICMAVVESLDSIDQLTLRGRSVAIVSDGSMLGLKGRKFLPVMDWFIAQIKFYSGIDAFPFVIRQNANLQTVFDDLSTCYGTILYLDNQHISEDIKPNNVRFLCQKQIVQVCKCQQTDAESTAYLLASIIKLKLKGSINKDKIKELLPQKQYYLKQSNAYNVEMNDGRDLKTKAIEMHKHFSGKIEIQLNTFNIAPLKTIFTDENLKRILQKKELKCKTQKLSAIVTDGTAILGFGNIGPEAGLPVMEGKSLLFKLLGDVDVVPLCIRKRPTVEKSVEAILDLLYHYEAINLEDFAAPECFKIQEMLSSREIMPIFHDDQHGTAIVTLAGLINALKVTKRTNKNCKIVINGAGAAGLTITKLLNTYGFSNIVVCDTKGAIFKGRKQNMNQMKNFVAEFTNKDKIQGKLQDALIDADVFIGVSVKNALKKEWVKKMNKDSIIFAMANPDPQISYQQAVEGGAAIYGSGRSDKINQINNSLAFPGIFRAIHEHSIKKITEEMKVKAAQIIANTLKMEPNREYIIPESLNKDVPIKMSKALGKLIL